MFDGPHSIKDQYDGIKIAQPALDDEFILIVDDWNAPHVNRPTLKVISDLNLIVDYIEIFTIDNGEHPKICRQNSEWHNGYFLASVKKSNSLQPI